MPHAQPQHDNIYTVRIYQSEAKPPPKRLNQGVTLLCAISCKLEMPWDQLPTFTNSNDIMYREFQFDLEMIREDASLEFKASFNGAGQASQNIAVEMDPSAPATTSISSQSPLSPRVLYTPFARSPLAEHPNT